MPCRQVRAAGDAKEGVVHMRFGGISRMTMLAGIVLCLGGEPAWAGAVYEVTLNTSPLTALSGSYSLFFQLTDGSGSGDANNMVTLSNFSFGGGGAVAPAQLFGGASGNLETQIALTDSGFFNASVQGFASGSQLSFVMNLTDNVDAGGIPDLFAMSILDANGNEIPSLDPSGANTLLSITFNAVLDIEPFATDSSTATSTGAFIAMDAPVVQPYSPPAGGQVPEPASLAMCGIGIAAIAALSRYRKETRR
jgi:hypothetical protein